MSNGMWNFSKGILLENWLKNQQAENTLQTKHMLICDDLIYFDFNLNSYPYCSDKLRRSRDSKEW